MGVKKNEYTHNQNCSKLQTINIKKELINDTYPEKTRHSN